VGGGAPMNLSARSRVTLKLNDALSAVARGSLEIFGSGSYVISRHPLRNGLLFEFLL